MSEWTWEWNEGESRVGSALRGFARLSRLAAEDGLVGAEE